MSGDVLNDLPSESRDYVVEEIQRRLDIDRGAAEQIVRASEPFWNAMEDAGGLVDSWGGGEFIMLLPRVLEFIRSSGT
jgi:hypothetical protein